MISVIYIISLDLVALIGRFESMGTNNLVLLIESSKVNFARYLENLLDHMLLF